MSLTQPKPKLSQASTSTPRAPSNDHTAISTAPVSDAGTIPMRYSSGISRVERVRSMTSANFARPSGERWERPRCAPRRASSDQPGRFEQGPDPKLGSFVRTTGADMPPAYRAAHLWTKGELRDVTGP